MKYSVYDAGGNVGIEVCRSYPHYDLIGWHVVYYNKGEYNLI